MHRTMLTRCVDDVLFCSQKRIWSSFRCLDRRSMATNIIGRDNSLVVHQSGASLSIDWKDIIAHLLCIRIFCFVRCLNKWNRSKLLWEKKCAWYLLPVSLIFIFRRSRERWQTEKDALVWSVLESVVSTSEWFIQRASTPQKQSICLTSWQGGRHSRLEFRWSTAWSCRREYHFHSRHQRHIDLTCRLQGTDAYYQSVSHHRGNTCSRDDGDGKALSTGSRLDDQRPKWSPKRILFLIRRKYMAVICSSLSTMFLKSLGSAIIWV